MHTDRSALLLVVSDAFGVVVLFSLSHLWITGTIPADLLFGWKMVAICGLVFLCNYLLDTFSLHSELSRLGIVERCTLAVGLSGAGIALLVYILGPSFIGGLVGRGVLALSLIGLWVWSLTTRTVLARAQEGRHKGERWLVIDASNDNAPSRQLAADFRRRESDRHLELLTNGSFDPAGARIKQVGQLDDFTHVVSIETYEGIIVAEAERLDSGLVSDLLKTRISGLRVHSLNDFYEAQLGRLPVSLLSEDWIALAQGFDLIHNPIGLRFKRYVDILVSIIAGAIFAQVFALTALAVLVTSGLPILFIQDRTGEHGRTFSMRKFRTMKRDAEATGAQFATVDDPRTTAIGGLLRKFRLDELPQLWNVLAGDMSLIGPRPERPVFIAELEMSIPYYNLRHLVKPGITGWAQVMHGYGDSEQDSAEKLQYDLFYIKNYSLLLDVGIVVRSARVVLFGTGR